MGGGVDPPSRTTRPESDTCMPTSCHCTVGLTPQRDRLTVFWLQTLPSEGWVARNGGEGGHLVPKAPDSFNSLIRLLFSAILARWPEFPPPWGVGSD